MTNKEQIEQIVIPRAEQETIVIFDVELGKWHIDTTYPAHIRKYRELMGKIECKNDYRLARLD